MVYSTCIHTYGVCIYMGKVHIYTHICGVCVYIYIDMGNVCVCVCMHGESSEIYTIYNDKHILIPFLPVTIMY